MSNIEQIEHSWFDINNRKLIELIHFKDCQSQLLCAHYFMLCKCS